MLIQKPPSGTDALESLDTVDDPDTVEGIPIIENGEACG